MNNIFTIVSKSIAYAKIRCWGLSVSISISNNEKIKFYLIFSDKTHLVAGVLGKSQHPQRANYLIIRLS